MRLGVDMDNVINDLGPLLEKRVQEHFGEKWTVRDIHKNYRLRDSLGISKLEEIGFWQKYGWEIANESPPKRFCRRALALLRENGFSIHIITARPVVLKFATEAWLKKHGIPYDQISYGAKNKGEECLKLNIQCMVEDADHNIVHLLQKGIPTIAFPYPYNSYIRHSKLIHIPDWRRTAFFLLKWKVTRGA